MRIILQRDFNSCSPAKHELYGATNLVAQINSLQKGGLSFQDFKAKCGNNSLKLIATASKWSTNNE